MWMINTNCFRCTVGTVTRKWSRRYTSRSIRSCTSTFTRRYASTCTSRRITRLGLIPDARMPFYRTSTETCFDRTRSPWDRSKWLSHRSWTSTAWRSSIWPRWFCYKVIYLTNWAASCKSCSTTMTGSWFCSNTSTSTRRDVTQVRRAEVLQRGADDMEGPTAPDEWEPWILLKVGSSEPRPEDPVWLPTWRCRSRASTALETLTFSIFVIVCPVIWTLALKGK